MDNSIKLLDSRGKTVASCRQERFGPGKIVNIIVKNGEDDLKPVTAINSKMYHFFLSQAGPKILEVMRFIIQ